MSVNSPMCFVSWTLLTYTPNELQKYINIVFPRFNSLIRPKCGSVYMNMLKTLDNVDSISPANIRTFVNALKQIGKDAAFHLMRKI